MSLGGRLAKAEGLLGDGLLWFETEKLAAQLGQSPEELYEEAHTLIDRYWQFAKPRPDGSVDIKPALRAIADGEGLDFDELNGETKRWLSRWRRREGRNRK